jgi:hypothetical protein
MNKKNKQLLKDTLTFLALLLMLNVGIEGLQSGRWGQYLSDWQAFLGSSRSVMLEVSEASEKGQNEAQGEAPDIKGYLDAMEARAPKTIESKIKATFPDNYKIMLAIAKAESGLDPSKISPVNSNGSIDYGVLQVNSCHGYDPKKLLNVDYNLEKAREIYEKQGMKAWSTYNNEKYLAFLDK